LGIPAFRPTMFPQCRSSPSAHGVPTFTDRDEDLSGSSVWQEQCVLTSTELTRLAPQTNESV
jgi:hypothetical protein